MLNFNKVIEIIISLQVIIISTFVPVYISIPSVNKILQTLEIPISWQVPSIIIITLIFKGKIVIKAFSIYLFIGLFILPVFQNGGSLGYQLREIYPGSNLVRSRSDTRKYFYYMGRRLLNQLAAIYSGPDSANF